MHVSTYVEQNNKHQKIHFIISPQDDSKGSDKEVQEFLEAYSSEINNTVEKILKQITKENNLFDTNKMFLFRNLKKNITDIRNRKKTLDLLDTFEKRVIQSSFGESDIAFTRIDVDGDVTTFLSEKGKNEHLFAIHHINVRFSEFLISEKFSSFMVSLSSTSYLIVSSISILSLVWFGALQFDSEQCFLFSIISNQNLCLHPENYWKIILNIMQLVGIPLASIFTRKKILKTILKWF